MKRVSERIANHHHAHRTNNNLISHFSFLIPHFLCLILLLFSCKTIPDNHIAPDVSGFVPLEPGAAAYVFADVKNVRPIINNINIKELESKQVKTMLDLTDYAMVAVFPRQDSRVFQVNAQGDYPTFKAKIGLGINKDWKKMRSASAKSVYWYSEKNGLSLAVNQRQTVVYAPSENIPVDPYSASARTELKVPDGFSEFRSDAVLSCWLEKADVIINKKLNEMGIPLEIPAEMLFLCLFPADSYDSNEDQLYEVNLSLQFDNASQAMAFSMLFSLARNFYIPGDNDVIASILFANPVVQDGINLDIKSSALSAAEIALLLNSFLL